MRLVNKLIFIYLSLYGTVSSAVNKLQFPEDGTFAEQKNYVDSLTEVCPITHSSELSNLSESLNPFASLTVVPSPYKAIVYAHEFFPENGVAITRKAINSPETIADETQIILQGKGDNNLVIHKFKLDQDGAWRPSAPPTEGSIEQYGEELSENIQGVVIKMTDTNNDNTCFTYDKKSTVAKIRPS